MRCFILWFVRFSYTALVVFTFVGLLYFHNVCQSIKTVEPKQETYIYNDYLLVLDRGFVMDDIESSNIVKDKNQDNVYHYTLDNTSKSKENTPVAKVSYTVPKSYEVYFYDDVTKDQYEELKNERLRLF